MSAQFGRWSFHEGLAAPGYIARVRQMLSPYGPDGESSYSRGGVDLTYCAFHTTKESRSEIQPHLSRSGVLLTWDGLLDNRAELTGLLAGSLSIDSSDVSIVAAAYERWGRDCFANLIGDWALSIWDPSDRAVILAKDPIGTRHLYYSVEKDRACWSTVLDPLILLPGRAFQLEEEYLAGWFARFPAAHLTPYAGICSVPPSSFVLIRDGKSTTRKYWEFDSTKRIRYRNDAEYEEHFRFAFAQSVRRRLRSDSRILAELSGGMDSSSIVCVADGILADGGVETPRLDTVSYYDDSEPHWNERPYFTVVEEKRGRAGCHIDVSLGQGQGFDWEASCFAATPGSVGHPSEAARQLGRFMSSQGHRVLLSGIGGDEVTGGVPTPAPELADLIATWQFRSLARQLKAWALDKRRPWFHLLVDAVGGFRPAALVGFPKRRHPVPWLDPAFARRQRLALSGYDRGLKLFGPLPSFQDSLNTLDGLRRQLACALPTAEPLSEKRYPFLDRDLLEFLYAVPRQQLVRPGQRRSLMRRALAGIVPGELLQRRRKAFVARHPRLAISANWDRWMDMTEAMVGSSLGIVVSEAFREALEKARDGHEVPIVPLLRTLAAEMWLQNVVHSNLLGNAPSARRPSERFAFHQQLLG